MNDMHEGQQVEGALVAEAGMVAMLNRSEIDQQITTAKRYPRSVSHFIKKATELVCLNESIAQQCIYALPRDGKVIEGPSARMAEVIFNAWGNSRAGARVVSDTGEFITAQGVFHDLEQNTAITFEVQRRITNKRGERFGADMIGVTGNAASSIALRNAILKGIPKAYWEGIYRKARALVAGDIQSLASKRANALKEFVIYGITEAQILAKLHREGVADINTDDLVLLFGMLTAIKEGDTTPEQAFAEETGDTKPAGKQQGQEAAAAEKKAALPAWDEAAFAKSLTGWRKVITAGTKTVDEVIATASSKGTLTDAQKELIRVLAPSVPAPPAEGLATRIQVDDIITKMADAAISTADLQKRFGLSNWPEVPAAMVTEILAFISNPLG